MNLEAILWMVTTQLMVLLVTVYLFKKILTKKGN